MEHKEAWYQNRILQHILFWLTHVVFYATLHGSFEENYGQTFYEKLIYLPGEIIFTYFTMYFLLPRFLLQGKYLLFSVWFIGASFAAGILQRYVALNYHYPIYYPQFANDPFFWLPKIIKMFAGIYPVTFIAVAIKLLRYWYANQQAQQILIQEKLEAELKFLKTQIHPHFLFNTLNNLYALTLKRSERAPEMVLKLSELINYMLYECRSEEVPLEKEIKFIRNYVDIEKMRYGDKLDVNITITGDVRSRRIAPLIILPFVENAFKHGASETLLQCWVKISIDGESKSLLIKVENSKSTEMNESPNAGIGIENVKRRLELLYPDRHELKILNGDETFLVILNINEK